jgi:hypothetical protein
MNDCHRCGAPIDAPSHFCRSCGTRLVQDPVPQPVSTGTSSVRTTWIAVVAASCTLVALAIALPLILSSASGGTRLRPAAVVTASTTATTVGVPVSTPESTRSPDPASTRSNSPQHGNVAHFTTYVGSRMTASIPTGWTLSEDEVQKPGYLESKWISTADPTDYLLIDISPATHLTPEQDAAPVHTATSTSAGYRELYYGTGDLLGAPSWMWVFQLPEAERIDYFFENCTNTFGVLGSSGAERFATDRPMFRAVARSVRSRCA